MKYKYSRKQCIEKLESCPFSYSFSDFTKDLLATKPEKECKHERVVTTPNGWEMWVCPDCLNVVEFKPTTSPLDEIEEVEEIDLGKEWEALAKDCKKIGVVPYFDETKVLEKYVNTLIRNQNKIISYLKKR